MSARISSTTPYRSASLWIGCHGQHRPLSPALGIRRWLTGRRVRSWEPRLPLSPALGLRRLGYRLVERRKAWHPQYPLLPLSAPLLPGLTAPRFRLPSGKFVALSELFRCGRSSPLAKLAQRPLLFLVQLHRPEDARHCVDGIEQPRFRFRLAQPWPWGKACGALHLRRRARALASGTTVSELGRTTFSITAANRSKASRFFKFDADRKFASRCQAGYGPNKARRRQRRRRRVTTSTAPLF